MLRRFVVIILSLLLVLPATSNGHQRRGGGYSNSDIGLAIFGGILDAMIRDSRKRSRRKANVPRRPSSPKRPYKPKQPRQPKKPDLPTTDPDEFAGDLLKGRNPFDNLDPEFKWTGGSNNYGGSDNFDFRRERQEMSPWRGNPDNEPRAHTPYDDIDWDSPHAVTRAMEIEGRELSDRAGIIENIEDTLIALKYAGKAAQLGLGFCTGAGVPSLYAQTVAAGAGGALEQVSSDYASDKNIAFRDYLKRAALKGGADAVTTGALGKALGGAAPGMEQATTNVLGFLGGEAISSVSGDVVSGKSLKKSFRPHGTSQKGWSGPGMNK